MRMSVARAVPVVAVLVAATAAGGHSAAAAGVAVPGYDHVFVVVEENHGFTDMIGNSAAPNLNALAGQFGLATNYFGVGHPSEANYVALLGGSTFGIATDSPYWMNRVDEPSLISQLDQAGIGWKAYLQGSPHPGFQGICYPSRCNGAPDADPLYVSKHDGIQNFASSLNEADWSRQVPDGQLFADLAAGTVPRFNWVIPDECHDMHGDPPYCIDGGDPFDPQDQRLVADGDHYLGTLVAAITNASFWAHGNNAIAIVYDEGDDDAGCCGSGGGGQVASVVVTNHGPRQTRDATPYNHYSLLQTIQRSFGLGCLESTCDTTDITPMAPLFAVTGAPAVGTSVLPEPNFPTPTPTPAEPDTLTTNTPSGGGWHVVPAAVHGTNDNSIGAVSGSSPSDVWAVGNFLPDTPDSNPDATLTLAEHYDGTGWSVVPTPNTGPNFATLFGVAARGGQAWAVGVRLDRNYRDRALVESWDGTGWRIADNPQPGTQRDLFYAASATSTRDVWAVGDREGPDGRFQTLAEHWDGTTWQLVPTPDPGTTGDHLYGVSAVSENDAWAVGQRLDASGADRALIEHWDGRRWSVLPSPAFGAASAMLDAVTASSGEVWAVGETDDATAGARPLVEQFSDGAWHAVPLPANAGSAFTDLWGVTTDGTTTWAVGTYYDQPSDTNRTLILRGGGPNWTVANGPDPGSGDNILAGATATSDQIWAVGTYDDGGNRLPLLERHPS